ncbi:hypothetical protein J3L18_07230 [Mucilaginibacter gossypii]|uniref:hypothetical protein n=1 Tax=Mucilaginibacter gossypii TaxID=551996 RepID=UPI00167ACA1D|nr:MULTISPECIES: hypothetical protein [Mucilaginibacter]QTE38850.1 hypothetical protein J3L18_07230 [Mucilaginibacter gossypii]
MRELICAESAVSATVVPFDEYPGLNNRKFRWPEATVLAIIRHNSKQTGRHIV